MTEPIRVWRKSSHSGADNGCVEILSPRYLFRGPAMGRLAPGSGMAVCPLSKSMTWGVLPPGFGAPLDR